MLRCLSHGSGFEVHFDLGLLEVCLSRALCPRHNAQLKLTAIQKTRGVWCHLSKWHNTDHRGWFSIRLTHCYVSDNFTWSWEVIESPWSYNSTCRALFGREHGTGNKKNTNCYYRQHFHWLSFQLKRAFFPLSFIFPLVLWKSVKTGGGEKTRGRGKGEQDRTHDATVTPTNLSSYSISLLDFLSSFSTACDPSFPNRSVRVVIRVNE